ncbi:MAG: hypothetical protein WAM24_17730 [Ignavibacteriaceae bacterium]
MQKEITDTNPKIEEILISLIRRKTITQRLIQFQDLTSLTLGLSKRALTRRYPGKTQRELDLLFVKYNYGEDLYKRVNQYLLKLSNEEK